MSTIVDIGCDTGHFILIAEKYFDRKQGKSMKLIGVDIDREVLRKAKIASEYSLFINADMFYFHCAIIQLTAYSFHML